MSKTTRSLFVFGIYMIVLGTAVVLIPNLLLSLFQVPPTQEVWIRIVGMLMIFLGIYDIVAARYELTPLIVCTIPVRLSVTIFLVVFVVAQLAPPTLLIFGAIDLIGAIWTWVEYRRESTSQPARAA